MKEINDEQIQSIEGGAGGYGNLQFTCVCGAEFLNDEKWAKHLLKMRHKSGTAYYQKVPGKLSKGTKVGNIKVAYNSAKRTIRITYPNGCNATWYYTKKQF